MTESEFNMKTEIENENFKLKEENLKLKHILQEENSKFKQELLKMTQELEKATTKLQNFTKHSVYWIHKAQKAEKKLADPKFNSQNLKRKNSTDQNQGEGTSSKMKERPNFDKNCK